MVVRHKAALTAAVMVAMVMQILDTTIANVALPHMQAALGATQDSISWVLTSYILASAVMIPLAGWLSSRFGARNLFLASLVLFVVASALCGVAQGITEMVVFRLFQGIGGAFLGPLAQTIMLDINRPSQHAKAMAIYGMGIMVGPILGPILGGYLTENFDWRWVFFVNVPIGALAIPALWILLPRNEAPRRRIDMIGWGLIAITVGALQLLLDRGHLVDWFSATEIWMYAAIGVSSCWMFIVHSATTPNPIFPIPMLRDRNLMTGTMVMLVVGMVMMAIMALLPSMLQNIYGYPVVDTGVILASRGVGVVCSMGMAGSLMARFDARLIVGAGFGLMAMSLWMMTGWSLEMDASHIVISGLVQGVGLGLVFVPLNVISFGTIAPEYRTDASSLFNLSRNIGASVGIAIVTALLARNVQVSHADLTLHVTSANLPVNAAQLQSYGNLGEMALAALDGIVLRQALMNAYLDDFYFMMIVSILVLPLLLILRRPDRNQPLPVLAE